MATNTGMSTPLSTSSTLTNPDIFKDELNPLTSVLTPSTPFTTTVTSASNVIESIASKNSSAIFIYDIALEAGFGQLTKKWSEDGVGSPHTMLQSRTGAGLILAGRLAQGSSTSNSTSSSVLTAYVTPEGLAQMVPTLATLPIPTVSGRIVIHVPTVSPFGPNLTLIPSTSHLSGTSHLPVDGFVVLFSATAKEAVEAAQLCYALTEKHVIHIFDYYGMARESRLMEYPTPRVMNAGRGLELSPAAWGWSPFEYIGSDVAENVLVILNGSLGLSAKRIATGVPGFGVLIVRTLKPWDSAAFHQLLPSSVQAVHILAEMSTTNSSTPLYEEVLATLLASQHQSRTHCIRLTHSQVHTFLTNPSAFTQLIETISKSRPANISFMQSSNAKKLLFLGAPGSSLSILPHAVAHGFSTADGIRARLAIQHDAYSKPGGISLSRLILTADHAHDEVPMDFLFPLGEEGGSADFVGILDQTLLKTHDSLKYSKPGSEVVIFSGWAQEEILSNISDHTLNVIRSKSLSFYSLDVKQVAIGLTGRNSETLQNVLAYLAILRLFLGVSCTRSNLDNVAQALFGDDVEGAGMMKIVEALWNSLAQLKIPEKAAEQLETQESNLKTFEFNAIQLESLQDQVDLIPRSTSRWHGAAIHLLFPEAFGLPSQQVGSYDQNPALRPDIEDRTYQVTCAVNRRLTPMTYDRNVFHLEFDTSGTGLKYAIGEALGIHGWNDEADVLDFCSWYGVEPDALVTIPVPNKPSQLHTRTVFQVLQQQVDIFGRPPKSFYSSLADHAASVDHRLALRFIGAAEGSATFKKLSEVDTVTFADILKSFDSARPQFSVLCELVGDIKPRHYSIASAQSAVGDRVDLLVVTVDWVTPSGSPRFGQCTRYLAGLKVGQKVTVSIKPSVMKLPPDNMQPIIMAGLGTGAAPFRAFIQHRAHLASQAIPVGPLVYYFGSRHRSQEYLYGEELEAHIADGIITHAGLAFSRDGKQKVYIQHKMMEDGSMLADLLASGDQDGSEDVAKGVFYLCGPTWPVPDVYKALVDALVRYKGYTVEGAAQYLEDLKEEERYVLEVY